MINLARVVMVSKNILPWLRHLQTGGERRMEQRGPLLCRENRFLERPDYVQAF